MKVSHAGILRIRKVFLHSEADKRDASPRSELKKILEDRCVRFLVPSCCPLRLPSFHRRCIRWDSSAH